MVQYNCGADKNADVVLIMRDMLRAGLYMPSTSWITPPNSSGVNEQRLKVLFKLATDWKSCTSTDVRLIFMSPDHRNAQMHQQIF